MRDEATGQMEVMASMKADWTGFYGREKVRAVPGHERMGLGGAGRMAAIAPFSVVVDGSCASAFGKLCGEA
nr:hypothetical protein CFP56_79546 [Quercus suber]